MSGKISRPVIPNDLRNIGDVTTITNAASKTLYRQVEVTLCAEDTSAGAKLLPLRNTFLTALENNSSRLVIVSKPARPSALHAGLALICTRPKLQKWQTPEICQRPPEDGSSWQVRGSRSASMMSSTQFGHLLGNSPRQLVPSSTKPIRMHNSLLGPISPHLLTLDP